MKFLKQCANSDRSWSSSSWSDLQFDMLKEIKKRLSYVDYIRFRGVCKNWRKVEDEKGNGELLLPWLCVPSVDWDNNFFYHLFEPPLASTHYRLDRDGITIESSHPNPINLSDDICDEYKICSAMYVDGWLYMVAQTDTSNIVYFLLFSLATKASFTLPQFNHPPTDSHSVFLAVSTTPDSPECVFFALFKTNEYTRTLAIFRHAHDTHWTRVQFNITPHGQPVIDGAVFIRGAFYFHLSTLAIQYYDLATTHQVLKLDHFSTPLKFMDANCGMPTLHALDGELMLTYYEMKIYPKFRIWKYDCSNKVWNPLNSLGGRSLYLSAHSLYVVPKNYNGVSAANKNYNGVASANKIYVHDGASLHVTEYTLEDDQPLQRNSTFTWGLQNYCYTPCAIWVNPPDVLLKFSDRR